jgi:hypothetical protein
VQSPSESLAQWTASKRSLPLGLLAGLVTAALVVVYVVGAHHHIHTVNTEILKADQGSYVYYARQMNETQYGYVGGRNQMPVMPFLVSLIDRHGDSTDELFVRGKYLNVALSLLVLAGVGWLARRTLPAFETGVMITIVAFTVFVYRSGYVQAELLFYGLFFLAFVLALWWQGDPRPKRAALCGVVLGVAYLTKASVLPLLAAVCFFAGVSALQRFRSGGAWLRPLAGACILVALFLATVFPYIKTSHDRFGQWFYNVNTTFYMWADSWDEVKEVMSGTGDREHWPDLSPELLPSAKRYFAEHTLLEAAGRIAKGMWVSELRHLIYMPFGYGKYLIFYTLVAVAVAIRAREAFAEACLREGRWVRTAFVLCVVGGYVVAYAFYSPIVRGPRLVLALYLPAMFSLFWFLSRDAIARTPVWVQGRFELGLFHVHLAALVVLAFDLVVRFPSVIVTDFAGA